ncbi:MAG: PAS domain S-box protein [Anaerolineae bacterium]|nr:PAS domain S-box protein [Anaerolineae bacterium]
MPENSRKLIEQALQAGQDPRQLIEELRQSEARYRRLAENATDMLSRHTPDGVYLYVSPMCRSLLGYEPEEMVGRNVYDFVHPDDRATVREAHAPLLEGTASARATCRVRRKDGEYLWAEVAARIVRDPDSGAILEIIGVARDVSDRVRAEREIKEQDLHYKMMLEMMSDYVFRVEVLENGDMEMDFVSENFTAITGRVLEETRSSASWMQIFHPDDLPAVSAFMRHVLTTGQPGELECRTFLLSRQQRWVQIFVRPDWDVTHRRVTTLVGAVRDITARKEAEIALRVSEEKYRSIYENIVVGIFQSTPAGRFLSVNPTMARVYGYESPEEMIERIQDIGRDFYANPQRRREFIQLLSEHDVIQDFEMENRRKDGSVIWTLCNARVIRDAHGEILYYEGTLQDITARKHIEAALLESEERYRSLVDLSPDGIALCTPGDDKIVFANPAMAQLVGVPDLADCVGRRIFEFIHPDSIPTIQQNLWEMRLSGKSTLIDGVKMRGLDGALTDVEVFATPFLLDGEPATQLIIRDITERHLLAAQLQQFADIAINMQVGLYVYHLEDCADDRSLRLVRANPASSVMMGLSEANMLGRRIDEIFPNLRAHNIPQHFAEVVRTGKPFVMDELFYEQDNLPMAVYAFRAFALPNDCVAVLFENITERKRAEARLRERLKFESLSGDLSARFINLPPEEVDDQIYQGLQEVVYFLGVERGSVFEFTADLQNFRVAHSYAVQGAPSLSQPDASKFPWIMATLQQGQCIVLPGSGNLPDAAQREYQYIRQGGLVSSLIVPMAVGGHNIGAIGFSTFHKEYTWAEEHIQWVQLVSEIFANALVRKRSEKERQELLETIREQIRRVQQIIDTLPEGVILLDVTDEVPPKVVSANPLGEEALLSLAEVWVGESLTHLGDRPIQDLLAAPPLGLWHELEAGGRAYQIIARPFVPGPGPGSWVLVIHDVTSMREIERQAKEQERLAVIGQMAAGIAHDFNNIMAAIVLYSQMLSRSEGLDEHGRERLLLIDQQARNATQLIQQILDFSRQTVFEMHPLDLLSLLKDHIRLFGRTLPENIHIQLEAEADEYVILGDPTRLQQVFMNLAVNARDAMPQGGILSFQLTRLSVLDSKEAPLPSMASGEWICVAVTDTGEGVPPELLPRLFTPFVTTKAPGKGTGLGLAQVHGLVSAHQGLISVSSEVMVGTTFVLYFPAHAVPVTASEMPEASALLAGQGETILVVEDNAATRAAIVESLEFLDYRVLTAANGFEALRRLEEHTEIALVLSDIVMPEMGGLELLDALQTMGAHTPVIFLTGHPSEENLKALQDLDANTNPDSLLLGWMLKPPNLEKLSEIVAYALEQIRSEDIQ